jgi:hypothetical protein
VPSLIEIGAFDIMQGQDWLKEVVFTRREREHILIPAGRGGEVSDKRMRKIKNCAAWAAKTQQEEIARAAETAEVEESALGQWATTKNAVGEIEEDMVVDETTKALERTEISAKQLWEDDLADRTK